MTAEATPAGVQPERQPSPYVSPYLSRKQAEEIWRLLHAQPQKKWAPHRRNFLEALRRDAGSKTYPEAP